MSVPIDNTDSLPIASPYAIDGRGRTAEAAADVHLRDLIEMVLFTNPGERVMRPAFGGGVLGLVFAPNSPELGATTQVLIAGALQTWLGDLIDVTGVEVDSVDASLTITVNFTDRRNGDAASVVFGRTV
jgi:phage baseplate assembly protein W